MQYTYEHYTNLVSYCSVLHFQPTRRLVSLGEQTDDEQKPTDNYFSMVVDKIIAFISDR